MCDTHNTGGEKMNNGHPMGPAEIGGRVAVMRLPVMSSIPIPTPLARGTVFDVATASVDRPFNRRLASMGDDEGVR